MKIKSLMFWHYIAVYRMFIVWDIKNVSIQNYLPLMRQGDLSEPDIAHHGALLGRFSHPGGQTNFIFLFLHTSP